MKGLEIVVAGVVLLGSLAVPAAADEFGCRDVVGTGSFATTPEPGTRYFRGDIPVLIDDRAYTIDSRSLNLGAIPGPGGGTVSRLLHRWEIKENGVKLVTNDNLWLTPTNDPNVFDAVIQFQVIGGSRFNCGEMVTTGQVDRTIPAFIGATFSGVLCNCDHFRPPQR
jgi:hypothetical protein